VDIHETYLRDGVGPAMAKFIALVSHRGPIPADFADQPAPEPVALQDTGNRSTVRFLERRRCQDGTAAFICIAT
jgi:hypothetical protein